MTFALAGNTGQPHRRPHDVLRGVGASQGVGIDQEAMQRLRIIMEVPELHDQFSRGRRVHARAKRGEHDRIGLFLPVRLSQQDHGELSAEALRDRQAARFENRKIARPHERGHIVDVIEDARVGELHALEHRIEMLRIGDVLAGEKHEMHVLETSEVG